MCRICENMVHQRCKKQVSIRGLNKDHNHDLKGLFKPPPPGRVCSLDHSRISTSDRLTAPP